MIDIEKLSDEELDDSKDGTRQSVAKERREGKKGSRQILRLQVEPPANSTLDPRLMSPAR